MMAKNRSKKRNDRLVIKLIFLKSKIQIRYSTYIFQTKCRNYCSC